MLEIQRDDAELLPEPRYPRQGWIGVDLDGTLAKAVRGLHPDAIGPAVPQMLKRVRYWINTGRTVKIFTARAGEARQKLAVQKWCLRHGLPKLEVTNQKDHGMIALWDDRAVGVVHNLGVPILPVPLTFWQRLRLGIELLAGRQPLMKVNQRQMKLHVHGAREASREFLGL